MPRSFHGAAEFVHFKSRLGFRWSVSDMVISASRYGNGDVSDSDEGADMKRFVLVGMLALAGCASGILQSYVGKDVTEVAMDYGPPAGVMDLPDGRRAFMWNRTQTMVTPGTTNYSGVQSGGWVTGTATTYGGGVSSWECTYTLIGQKNPRGSYTVVDYRKPKLECE